MNRAELTALMTSWGWEPEARGSIPYETWIRRDDLSAPAVLIPTETDRDGYERHLRRARQVLARAEADRMFSVIVRCMALADEMADFPLDGTESGSHYGEAMFQASRLLRDALAGMRRG